MHGATILEKIKVEEVRVEGGKVRGVRTDQGIITADYMVNCGGMWARELGQKIASACLYMLAKIIIL